MILDYPALVFFFFGVRGGVQMEKIYDYNTKTKNFIRSCQSVSAILVPHIGYKGISIILPLTLNFRANCYLI